MPTKTELFLEKSFTIYQTGPPENDKERTLIIAFTIVSYSQPIRKLKQHKGSSLNLNVIQSGYPKSIMRYKVRVFQLIYNLNFEMQEAVIVTTNVQRKTIPEGKLLNQYLKIKKIGEGPYSKIKLMKNISDNKLYAMKKYNLFILKKKNKLLKKQKDQAIYTTAAEEVLNQVRILKQVNHPNIAKLIEVLEDHQEEKLYLFLEYCENGDIAEWVPKKDKFILNKKISDVRTLIKSFLSIAKAIQYLHSNDIVHRDIKPQNILIDREGNVKVIDFGRAVKLENKEQKLKGSEGTYHFMAPEMLSEVFKQGYDGKKCDMWSLGVTFYGILFQSLPFYHQLLIKLFQQIENGLYTLPENRKPEYEIFVPIIQNLLRVNSEQRWTISELRVNLERLLQ